MSPWEKCHLLGGMRGHAENVMCFYLAGYLPSFLSLSLSHIHINPLSYIIKMTVVYMLYLKVSDKYF
jgi:hypothetical protein